MRQYERERKLRGRGPSLLSPYLVYFCWALRNLFCTLKIDTEILVEVTSRVSAGKKYKNSEAGRYKIIIKAGRQRLEAKEQGRSDTEPKCLVPCVDSRVHSCHKGEWFPTLIFPIQGKSACVC